MSLQIVSQPLPKGRLSIEAGYGCISWFTFIGFYDYIVDTFAKTNGYTVRRLDYLEDGKYRHEAYFAKDGVEIIKYWVRVK